MRGRRHRRLPGDHDVDMKMQATVEKWLKAAGRAPLAKTVDGTYDMLRNLKIPQRDRSWIVKLRGKNIHNAAGAVIDYRTGEVLAVGGSADFYLKVKDKQFSPQHDVMFEAFRQPGSSIKPISYITGLDDGTMNAATMFMDVVTEFEPGWTPADADRQERGPVRMRPALQFSLNIPAIKSGYINGMDHLFAQYQKFGLEFNPGSVPTPSMAIGTLELHMIDLLGAYGAIANGGVLMPQTVILEVKDHDGEVEYPTSPEPPTGTRGREQAGVVHHHGHPRGQHDRQRQPLLGDVGGLRQGRAPAGRLQDGHDRREQGHRRVRLRRAAEGPGGAGDRRRRLAGQLRRRRRGSPCRRSRARPRCGTTSSPRSRRARRSRSSSGPTGSSTSRSTRGAASGRARAPSRPSRSCSSTARRKGSGATTCIPCARSTARPGSCGTRAAPARWSSATSSTSATSSRASTSGSARTRTGRSARPRGSGVYGGPRRTPTSYFFDNFVVPFGRTWGGRFPPRDVCTFQPPICEDPGGGPPTPEPSDVVPCVTLPPAHGRADEARERRPQADAAPPSRPGTVTARPGYLPGLLLPLAVPVMFLGLGRLLRPNRPNRRN